MSETENSSNTLQVIPESDLKPERQTRFESKESLPRHLSLKGTVVFSEKATEEGTTGEAVWVTGNTDKDFTHSADALFLPPMSQGNWLTGRPRSLMQRAEWGYTQYKGTGNIDRPNFPPRINSKTDDDGHKVIWGVSKNEAEITVLRHRMLENNGILHVRTLKTVKLDELPVPLENGGVEIRSFTDAYLKPWEYGDHVRRREIREMKNRLIKSHQIPADNLQSDEDIVNSFYDYEGFYQIQTEKPVPFKNDIGHMIESPLLLDYLSGNKEFSLDSQAKKVVWVLNEMGRAYRISELENLQLSTEIDLTEYTQDMFEVPIDEFYGKDDENKLVAHRPMRNLRSNIIADTEAKRIRVHYGLSDSEPLQQIDGFKLLSTLVNTLPPSALAQYRRELEQDQDNLVFNHVRAGVLGIGLGQAMSSKDSVLGSISDYWLVGTKGPQVKDYNDEDLLRSLKREQLTLIDSCTALDKLEGRFPSDPHKREAHLSLVAITIEQKIAARAAMYALDVSQMPLGSDDYKTRYVQRIKELSVKYGKLWEETSKTVRELTVNGKDPWENEEVLNLSGDLAQYPMFVRRVNVGASPVKV